MDKKPASGGYGENMPQFFICRTCGKYITRAEIQNAGFCSLACMEIFSQCITCGRYVMREDVYETYFCGPECATQYTFLKSMGPRPIIVSSEQTPDSNDNPPF